MTQATTTQATTRAKERLDRTISALEEAGFSVSGQTRLTTLMRWNDAPRGVTTVAVTAEDGITVIRANGRGIEYTVDMTSGTPISLVVRVACGK